MRLVDLRRLAWIAMVAPLVCGACSSTDPDGEEAVGDVTQALSPLSEALIAGITRAINDGEIAEGQIAVLGAQAPAVVAFAQKMVADHTLANQDQAALLSSFGLVPAASAVSEMLTTVVSSQGLALQMVTGPDFDQLYMDYQVQLHQMALTLLDALLIPSADHVAFRDLLLGARDKVAMHLDLARKVSASLHP